jgi:AcrR family transcriptional regulator
MILQAALREFAEQGYEGATTASIARHVGVTQPLVHYHFGSKEALWRATVAYLFERLDERIGASEKQVEGMGPAARLVTLTYDVIDFFVEHPELSRIMVNEGIVQTPRLTWLVDTYLRDMIRQWERFLVEGRKANLFKEIPNAYILLAFLGALQNFFDMAPLVRELFGIDARSPEVARDYANTLIEMFLEGAATRSSIAETSGGVDEMVTTPWTGTETADSASTETLDAGEPTLGTADAAPAEITACEPGAQSAAATKRPPRAARAASAK